MKKRAVISFDLDGTLIGANGRVHPQDVWLLSSNQPYWFIPATGRPLHSARAALHQAGLFENGKIPLPMLLQNGAVLYNTDEVLLHHDPFALEVQQALIERLQKATRVTVLFKAVDTIYPLRITSFGSQRILKYHFIVQDRLPADRGQVFNKIMCLCQERGPLEEILADTETLPAEKAFSMDSILEFTPSGVNKGSGLRKMIRMLGLEDLPLLASGDGGNDLAMLKEAHLSFAPLSSPEEIRSQVAHVVDTREQGLLTAMIAALPEN